MRVENCPEFTKYSFDFIPRASDISLNEDLPSNTETLCERTRELEKSHNITISCLHFHT